MTHITRCFIAGIVALLPIGGTILTVAWLESTIHSAFFQDARLYFPGLGLLAVCVALYAIGFAVTSIGGRWLFGFVDAVLGRVPLLGLLYRSLKQILGYAKGEDALFQRVVLVPSRDAEGFQLGLVTRTAVQDDPRELVFVPGSPNPATGRLIVVEADRLRPAGLEVHEALELLVTVGKASHRLAAREV